MEPVKFPVIITLLVLLLYVISPFTGVDIAIIFFLLLILGISTVWMVVRILKDGKPGKYTFEEQWYDYH